LAFGGFVEIERPFKAVRNLGCDSLDNSTVVVTERFKTPRVKREDTH